MKSSIVFVLKANLYLAALFIVLGSVQAQELTQPTFQDILSLEGISGSSISPDGQHVLFSKGVTDWKENRFDREIWISKNGEQPFQLTYNADGNSYNAQWSPDGKWITFLSKFGEHTQIHITRTDGGAVLPLTHSEGNIADYEWSPNGAQILFTQSEDRSKEIKKREDELGAFAVEDEEFSRNELWIFDFEPERIDEQVKPEKEKDSTFVKAHTAHLLLDSTDFSINSFLWSPDGKHIAIGHQPDPMIMSFFKADISIIDLADTTVTALVTNESYDGLESWSPDGRSILYQTDLDNSSSNFYQNSHLFTIDIATKATKKMAAAFDENLNSLEWNDHGIFAIAWQKTKRRLIHITPETGEAAIIPNLPERVMSYSFSKDGTTMAFSGVNDHDLRECYKSAYPNITPTQLSNSSAQIRQWAMGTNEVISWKSKDGAIIEGVLHKPHNYDPNNAYPLLVAIHGGPTGISTPNVAYSYVYPVTQWLNKGALVLRPNYRGSAGYGEAFRSLNVRNLGVGDAWDVLSGVDHLIASGVVDKDKVGCMGWSQGGYISAFLATNSTHFKAISVGAGISNWMTYYVNTDIHPFTRQYLKATPWNDHEIYERTSPMTNINQAKTPTLIQHGEFDRRVPVANAYELYQGLQDVGVTTKLIIYKGFGHGITKPKERLGAMQHNWEWFEQVWEE